MAVVNIEGLGFVEIAGDEPTREERQAILRAYDLAQKEKVATAAPDPLKETAEIPFADPEKADPEKADPEAGDFHWTTQLIPQMAGGVIDAANNLLKLTFDDLPSMWESKFGSSGGISWADKEGKLTFPRYLPPDEWGRQQESLRSAGKAATIGDLELPEVEPAQNAGGQLVRTMTQFFVPFLGAMKVIGAGKTALGTVLKTETGAVLTGQAVFDPFDQKLADLIQSYPQLENPVTEYLQAGPEDSVAEARFKLALEDIGLGAVANGVATSLRALGYLKRGDVEKATSDIDEASQTLPRTEEAPSPDEVLSSRGVLDPDATKSKIDEVDQAAVEHAARRLIAEQASESIEDVPVTLAPGSQVVKTHPPKFAGNINLDNIETLDDIKQVIIDTAGEFEGVLEKARRGVISDEQLKQLASDLDMTPEDLMSRRPGELWSAEKILAARQLMLASATKVRNAAIDASRSGLDQDFLSLKDAMSVHVGIQQQVAGLAAEAGRALRQFRFMPGMSIDEALLSAGGKASIKQIADRISVMDPNNLGSFNKVIKAADDPTKVDKFLELWINELLSGYKTHAVNATSNALTQLFSIPEKYAAAAIGAARGADKTKRLTFAEANQHLFALTQGIIDGFKLGKQTLISGEPSDLFSKLESRRQKSIGGTLGEIIRIPGRLLMTSDEFFKGIGYRMELNSLAYRDALQAGLDPAKDPQKFAKHIQKIIDNPPEKLNLQAMYVARDRTFTKPLGTAGQHFQGILADHPTLRILAPFVRTPVNIVKYAAERTPFGALMKKTRDAKGIERDEQLGKLALGSAAMAAVAYGASKGMITGSGPSDPQARARKRETGWQPSSFVLSQEDGRKRYVSYTRVEPLGIVLGLGADFSEIAGELGKEDADSLAAMMSAAVSQNLLDKTFFKGISDFIEAINQPDRRFQTYINNQLGTLVPTILAQTAQNVDPILRETRTALDRVKSRIPGYSQSLAPRRNLWGEMIVLEGGLGPDFISPIYSSYSKEDPVSDELERLNVEQRMKYYPSLPQRTIDGEKIPPELYSKFVARAGQLAHRQLSLIIQSPRYKQLGEIGRPGLQVEQFKRTINRNRKLARKILRIEMGGKVRFTRAQQIEMRDLQAIHPDLYDNIELPAGLSGTFLIDQGINFNARTTDRPNRTGTSQVDLSGQQQRAQ